MNFEYVKPEGVSRGEAIGIIRPIKQYMIDCCVEQKKITPFISFSLVGDGDEENEFFESGFQIFMHIPVENQNRLQLDGLNVEQFLKKPIYSLRLNKYPDNHLIFWDGHRFVYNESVGYGVLYNEDVYTWRYEESTIKSKIQSTMDSWINRLTLKNVRTI